MVGATVCSLQGSLWTRGQTAVDRSSLIKRQCGSHGGWLHASFTIPKHGWASIGRPTQRRGDRIWVDSEERFGSWCAEFL